MVEHNLAKVGVASSRLVFRSPWKASEICDTEAFYIRDSYMAKLSRNAIIGYPAGIITGIKYGLNPLFAKLLTITGILISAVAVTFIITVTKR